MDTLQPKRYPTFLCASKFRLFIAIEYFSGLCCTVVCPEGTVSLLPVQQDLGDVSVTGISSEYWA